MRQTMKKLVLMMVIFLTWSNCSVHCQSGSGSEEFLEDYIIEDNFVIEGEDYEESDFCSEGSGITNKQNHEYIESFFRYFQGVVRRRSSV